jgi:hypothetical protein
MKKGIIFGIGVGILIIGVLVGMGARSTPLGLPGMGGLPDSDENQMSMSDDVQVSVSRGEPISDDESTDNVPDESKTIETNLDDGAGSTDNN